MSKSHKESFVRWQGITITQLGFAVNLILTFAAASLGFSLTLLKDEHFVPQRIEKVFFDSSLTLTGLSLIFGILCVIKRPCDFRQTTQIAKDRERWGRDGKTDDQIDADLEPRRQHVKSLGKCTWGLFWAQVASFGLGLVALVLVFISIYRHKLF